MRRAHSQDGRTVLSFGLGFGWMFIFLRPLCSAVNKNNQGVMEKSKKASNERTAIKHD
jgi:hypothetical protein